MPFTLVVPEDYGYVLLVSLGLIPVLSFMQGNTVASYRKAAKVPYPNAYASIEQVKQSKEAYTFNCAQRAHAQLLENMPQTMLMMLAGGLTYPRVTAAMGLGWTISRVLFAYGYITSTKPAGQGRYMGGAFWLFQAGIWGTSIATALRLIM